MAEQPDEKFSRVRTYRQISGEPDFDEVYASLQDLINKHGFSAVDRRWVTIRREHTKPERE